MCVCVRVRVSQQKLVLCPEVGEWERRDKAVAASIRQSELRVVALVLRSRDVPVDY